jgi:hypothetical protein
MSITFQEFCFGSIVVERRITLTDIDRPGEALEVDIVAADEASLTLAVPNTSVQFRLFRHSRNAPYQGSLGGRSFCFIPVAGEARKGPREASGEIHVARSIRQRQT